jgi:hypothetical protein
MNCPRQRTLLLKEVEKGRVVKDVDRAYVNTPLVPLTVRVSPINWSEVV